MNNRDKTFLQKVKDNAFYVALGLGMFAVLALVGVYTAQQSDTQIAENDMDLNVASNYSDITEEDVDLELVEETNADVADNTSTVNTLSKESTTEELAETALEEDGDTEEDSSEEKASEESTVPTATDASYLDFNSEKTITWPVNGKVILPYSMETTIYFETLDQYKCNPGMMIQAGVGTTVRNAYSGQVTSVTSDNTYGNLVTVYLGNDYSVVYGQLDTVYVKKGDFVEAGQSIGTVGNPTDSFSEEGSHLFFRMEQGEHPVDPMLYISQEQ